MQNYGYPFNQKQHIFDFKVKVNFENGNVSLTAPQIVNPPAYFANPPSQHTHIPPTYTNTPINPTTSISKPPTYPLSHLPHYHPTTQTNPPQYQQPSQSTPHPSTTKHQPIQLVNSSYTSMRDPLDYSHIINNSIEVIECVLCQKSFNANEFDQHLELHRHKHNRTQLTTNHKNNASHYALTQNSFNANNDSHMSAHHNHPSFHNHSNQSFHSNSSKTHSAHNDSAFFPNFTPALQSPITNQHQSLNESSQLLGRIDNPILAINAQQSNLSLSSSSHHQSLSYSNSQNQSIQRPNNLGQIQSMEQSPNFNPVNMSNGSSFGHHGGNNLIGPSFYQNSSHESGNMRNGAFVKGVNRLAYNDANNSVGSHQSLSHQTNQNMIPNTVLPNNESYHSHHSYNSNGPHQSHHSQQYINSQLINNSNGQYQNQNNSTGVRNSQNPSYLQPSYHSHHQLQHNQFPSQNMMGNFQTIQSRYLNQPITNSRGLYASQQELNMVRNQRNNASRQHDEGLFNENDISSISGQSRKDMSDYSEWSDFNRRSDDQLQGYNSADNSIIKHMQSKKSQQHKNDQNIYIQRSQSKQKTSQGFFKKQKDHMIASTASYYDRKFKDEDYFSSDDEQFVNNTGRLSYAERLKEKRVTDNSRPMELSSSKSGRASRNLKQSSKSINSEDSSLSKTKLPLNYLAREEFISTSSTSKSTHKTNLPN